MSETKLLPCPFCGGEAEMLNYSENEWLVSCTECDGMVERWRETENEAVEQWNTRKPIDDIVAELEKDTTCRGRLDGYIPKSKAIDIVRNAGKDGAE